MKHIDVLGGVVVAVVIMLLPLLELPVVAEGWMGVRYWLTVAGFVVFGGVACRQGWRQEDAVLRLSAVDVWVGVYVLYGVVHGLCVGRGVQEEVVWWEWGGMVALYIWMRGFAGRGRWFVAFGVFGAAFAQAVVGWLQYGHWLPSNHGWFPVTGCFGNPGPYGGFLAVGMVAGVACCLKVWRWSGWKGWWCRVAVAGMLLGIGGMLVVADSRAAWLGTLVGTGLLAVEHWGWKKWGRRKWRWLEMVIGMLIMAVLLAGMYGYRQGSADARLLIWRVGVQMFAENPWTGHGSGSFAARYMDTQADFLEEHPEYAGMADGNQFAFNEFVRLGCEQGLVGLVLTGGVLVALWRGRRSGFWRKGGAGLAAWWVFAFFSYPLSVSVLKFLLPLLMGMVPVGSGVVVHFPGRGWRWMCRGGMVGCLVGCGMLFQLAGEERVGYRGLQERDGKAVERFAVGSSNQDFLLRAGCFFLEEGEKEKAVAAWERLMECAPSPALACRLGRFYRSLGKTEEALRLFVRARRMVPCHMEPLYELFCTCRDLENRALAEEYARRILALEVPVCNSVVLRARRDAKEYLKMN